MALFCKPAPKISENGLVGRDVKFERIRRITGYLVGTLDRFNNAKRREEADRVRHLSSCGCGRDS